MELFDQNGCLTEEGLHAVIGGQLDELGRLEAAEHLSYCDKCMDRYTALLTADVLKEPPRSARGAVMGTIWVRLMQNTWGRAAVAAVAAVLALTMWRSGTLEQILSTGETVRSWLPETTQTTEPERLGRPVQDDERVNAEPPETLYHGTARRFSASIEAQGLLPQSRLYVHLSPDVETAEKVGRRHGEPVIYLVDAGQMHRDGSLFYLSANGVWLTKTVPAPYLKRLEE